MYVYQVNCADSFFRPLLMAASSKGRIVGSDGYSLSLSLILSLSLSFSHSLSLSLSLSLFLSFSLSLSLSFTHTLTIQHMMLQWDGSMSKR